MNTPINQNLKLLTQKPREYFFTIFSKKGTERYCAVLSKKEIHYIIVAKKRQSVIVNHIKTQNNPKKPIIILIIKIKIIITIIIILILILIIKISHRYSSSDVVARCHAA